MEALCPPQQGRGGLPGEKFVSYIQDCCTVSVCVCARAQFLCHKLRTHFLHSMIRDTTRLYRKFYQKRVKATVLYATETGRSRSYANIVKDVFGKVFAAKVGRGRVEEGGWVKSGGESGRGGWVENGWESRGGGRRMDGRVERGWGGRQQQLW